MKYSSLKTSLLNDLKNGAANYVAEFILFMLPYFDLRSKNYMSNRILNIFV